MNLNPPLNNAERTQYVRLFHSRAMDDGKVIGVMQVEEAITGIDLSGKHIRHRPKPWPMRQ
jgi:hypothetical protein